MSTYIRANLVYVGSVIHLNFPTTKRTFNICNDSKYMCKEISSQNTVRGMGSKTQLPATIRAFPYVYSHEDFSSGLCYNSSSFPPRLGVFAWFSPKVSVLPLTSKNCSQVLSGVISIFYASVPDPSKFPSCLQLWGALLPHARYYCLGKASCLCWSPHRHLVFRKGEEKKKLLTTTEWVFHLLRSISVKDSLEAFFFPQLVFATFLSLLLLSSASLVFIWWPVVIEGSPTDPSDLRKSLPLCHGEALLRYLLDFSSFTWQGC